MKRFFQRLPNWIPGLHPAVEELLAWYDGQMLPAQARQVAAHLADCRRCRQEAALLYEAIRESLPADLNIRQTREQLLEDGFRTLHANMHAWRSLQGLAPRHALASSPHSVIHQRITTTVRFYFGALAASRIERVAGASQPGEPHLLPSTKALFSAFLGKRAADALARQIVRSAA